MSGENFNKNEKCAQSLFNEKAREMHAQNSMVLVTPLREQIFVEMQMCENYTLEAIKCFHVWV